MNRDKTIRKYVEYNNRHLSEGEKPLTLAEADRKLDRLCSFLEEMFKSGEEIKINGYFKIYQKIFKGRTYRTGKSDKEYVIGDRLVPRCEFGTKIEKILKNK